MKLSILGGILIAGMTGCAAQDTSSTRYPQFDQNRQTTTYQGQLQCAHCPDKPISLTLSESTVADPMEYLLRIPGEKDQSGTVFETMGNLRYPNQTIYQLVAPLNHPVMTLLALDNGVMKVLNYQDPDNELTVSQGSNNILMQTQQ
ncbi:hypothetical protein [Phytohalomonas tamaricis]|uniref:hypothetical protein n=1 Tax=Phytohalomonas tamaricis TaxID=2081032 RepID=UPI000D0B4ABF|nr:hypothetical protein [Phytohalomonas tamaricis]